MHGSCSFQRVSLSYHRTKHARPHPFIRTIDGRAGRRALPVRADILVSVIDDDESVRESIPNLLRVFGFGARTFDSAEAFLASDAIGATKCLILDVAMPGMSGPELFEQLKQGTSDIPVIFITAHGNAELCGRLIRRGAAGCLQKPFDPMALIEALQQAVP